MPLPNRVFTSRMRDFGIGVLFESSGCSPTQSGERALLGLVLPPWQRPEVWSIDQKTRFIEGILLGLSPGTYITNGPAWNPDASSAPMAGWLIDGQQRISALRDFVLQGLVVFGDVTFAGLETPAQRRFMRIPFHCQELDYVEQEPLLKDLYNRLNFGGTPHQLGDRAIL